METHSLPTSRKNLLIAVGACSLLVLFACAFTFGLGTGGLLWLSRSNRDAKAVQPQSIDENVPANSLTALRGWVEVQDADGTWEAAQDGQEITVGQHVRTGALSGAVLRFQDGSQATLQADSELVIDRLEPGEDGSPRVIILTQLSGESSHEVAKNTTEGSEYLVNTPGGSGEAKGTVFNVIITPAGDAYYVVSEGVVAVTAVQMTVLVNAGEMTTILFGQPPLAPVLSISGQGLVTQTGASWVIAGQDFAVTEDTIISGSPQVGDWVLVKGRVREDGVNEAIWIVLLRAAPANRFSITGLVETTGETEWTVQGQVIQVDAETEIDEDIAVDDRVRVTGLVLEDGLLQAKSIQLIDEEDGLRFDFTGVVQSTSPESWDISGATVLVDEDTWIEAALAAGDVVRVEGRILEDGGWLAERISAAADELPGFHITGELESRDPWQVAGLAFETRDYTVIEDGLDTGDLVRVEGRIDAQGLWIADTIEKLDDEVTRLVLIGTVLSMDPWVVNGIPLTITDATVIGGEIKIGMLVRVEIVLAADGSWQIVLIEPLEVMVWFPGCMDIVATVISVNGSEIQLENWPVLFLGEDVEIEGGDLTPNSVVRFRVCFNDDMTIYIVYIIIIDPGVIDLPDPIGEGGKVTVCHKPGKKKGGHSITISRSALGAHLGHGDYEGACR